MFKHLVVVFVLSHWGDAIVYPAKNPADAAAYPEINLPSIRRSVDSSSSHNSSTLTTAEDVSKGSTITMNGNTNYHVGQQIFYMYGEQMFKKLFADNKRAGILENDYLVTTGMGAHKIHGRKLTWNKARKACIEEGGHLAIINSASEEKILLRMMQEKSIGEAWLGLHDLYDEGDWVTVTDVALENTGFTRWATKFANLPDNYGGNQNCAVLITEGGIDDVACGLTHSFFCEIPV